MLLCIPRQLGGRSRSRGIVFRPCVTGRMEETSSGPVRRCRMAGKYGNLFVFRILFPGVVRVRNTAGRRFCSWGGIRGSRPISFVRLLVVGLFLGLWWLFLGVALLQFWHPRRLSGLAQRLRILDYGADTAAAAPVSRDREAAGPLIEEGDRCAQAGSHAEAIESYRRALVADPFCQEAQAGLGRSALALEDKDTARAAFASILRVQPEHPGALEGAAEVALRDGASAQARRYARTLEALHPGGGRARLIEAKALEMERDLDGAAEAVRQALERLPEDAECLYVSGRIAEARGDMGPAARAYAAIPSGDRHAVAAELGLARIALREGKAGEALDRVTELRERYPDREDVVLLLADVVSRRDGPAQAARVLELTLADHPDLVQVRNRLGDLYVSQGRWNDAYRTYSDILERAPGNLTARLQLAAISLAGGLSTLAVEHCRRAVAQAPGRPEAYRLYGKALLADGRHAEAEAVCRRMVASLPGDLDATLQLAECLVRAGRLEEGARLAEEVIAKGPDRAAPYRLLTEIAYHRGDLQQALSCSRQALRLAPEDILILNNHAALLAYTGGDLEEALRLARQAYDLMPDNPLVCDTLGWILVLRGDHREALSLLTFARRHAPGSPDAAYHLAKALHLLGRTAEAHRTVRAALALDGPFPQVEEARRLLEETAPAPHGPGSP